jgi:hypothetical protein
MRPSATFLGRKFLDKFGDYKSLKKCAVKIILPFFFNIFLCLCTLLHMILFCRG